MVGLETGQEFAGHRIEGVVGRGGMGVVYRATEIDLGRQVALKLVAPELAGDVSFRARFERECRIAASIDHPNVIPIFDAGEESGLLYLTMRYVPGTDLAEIIENEGTVEPERAAAIIDQMAQALDAAHEDGLVHRDIKPGNTLVIANRGREHVYLTDFGLTKSTAQTGGLTRSGTVVGTPDYMAPEQWDGRGSIDARADVYSLGCVLHELLTGKIPFERDSDPQKMYAHLSDEPPRVTESKPGLPSELDDVVARAMAKNPEDRYPSAGDLGRAAVAAAHGEAARRPERTVATGRAAPTRTATPREKPGASPTRDAPTTPMADGGDGSLRGWIAAAVVILLLGAVGAMAAAGVFSGSDDKTSSDGGANTNTNDQPTPPIGTTPAPDNGGDGQPTSNLVTEEEITDTLSAYATAYTSEDISALSALLTPDFTRSETNKGTLDKSEAKDEYRRQFGALTDPQYGLDQIDAIAGEGEGSADARYLITGFTTEDNEPVHNTGDISFSLKQSGGSLKINEIAVVPD